MKIFLKQVIFCFFIYGTKIFSEATGINVAQELDSYVAANGLKWFEMASYQLGVPGTYQAVDQNNDVYIVAVTEVKGSCEVNPQTQWVEATVLAPPGSTRLSPGPFFGPIMWFAENGKWVFCPLSPTFWGHFWPYPRRGFIRAMRICLFTYIYVNGRLFAAFIVCVEAAISVWYPWILSGARRLEVEATVCGDPHFKTFHGEHFSYHGECDLVLMKTDQFSNGLGLSIHIRTKIEKSWSYVKNAAIKIGEDVLEVEGHGKVWDKAADAVHYINGTLDSLLPSKLSGKYAVTRVEEKQCNEDKSKCVDAIVYKVDLADGSNIQVTQKWGVLRVSLSVGDSEGFDVAVGLMGHFNKPGFWARDGITKFTDININQFGQEWQVQESEPMIFNERRAPQHPEQCLLPAVSTKRRLGEDSALHQMALDACAGVEEASKEFCLLDVTAAGRVEAASTYYTAYVG